MKKDTSFLKQSLIAHRGKHNIKKGIPENSIKELEIISKLYLNEKLEKEYKLEDLFKK